MNDYKELVENLRAAGKSVELADGSFDIYIPTVEKCHNAADAIEQLVKERDAAVADLKNVKACKFCKNLSPHIDKEPCYSCLLYVIGQRCTNNFEWRGVQEDNDEID